MDPLSLLVGAGLFTVGGLAGLLAGWLLGRRQRTRPDANPKPVCGCGDHLAKHNRKTGECHGQVLLRWWDRRDMQQWVRCGCQQYVGPEPITELWSPPVLTEGSGR